MSNIDLSHEQLVAMLSDPRLSAGDVLDTLARVGIHLALDEREIVALPPEAVTPAADWFIGIHRSKLVAALEMASARSQ